MKWLIKVIFKAVKLLLTAILTPLNLIINQFMPGVADIISQINGFFTAITNGVLWVKSWLPFTSAFYTILVSVLTFSIMVPLLTHSIKVIVAWYNKLKP